MKHSQKRTEDGLLPYKQGQLGHGAIKYLAEVFGCSRRTIERGILELNQLPDDPASGRVRRLGAGRKKTIIVKLTP